MIRVCYVCGRVFGEKEPFEDKSSTHGLCDSCFPKELERLKREREKIKKNKGERKMNTRKPKIGDFVLFEDDVFIITSIRKGTVRAESVVSRGVYENLYIETLEPTAIKTWEAQ